VRASGDMGAGAIPEKVDREPASAFDLRHVFFKPDRKHSDERRLSFGCRVVPSGPSLRRLRTMPNQRTFGEIISDTRLPAIGEGRKYLGLITSASASPMNRPTARDMTEWRR